MNELLSWAQEELDGYFTEKDKFSNIMTKDVMEVLEVLCKQNHSGISAPWVIGLVRELWMKRPLTPLTGEDDEWEDKGEEYDCLYNKRCHRVYKDKKTGKAYDREGIIFAEPDGCTFTTNRGSHVEITFPYVVKKPPVYRLLEPSENYEDMYEVLEKKLYTVEQ